jgi:hypothetical protein
MQSSIALSKKWYDQDLVELAIEVCDGTSQFKNTAYVGHDWFGKTASALTTFSRQVHGGIYDLKAGEQGPEYANGAFKARFHFHKPIALFITTVQQTDHIEFKGSQVAAEARMYLRTEPGFVDHFAAALSAIDKGTSSEATLECIPLDGRRSLI